MSDEFCEWHVIHVHGEEDDREIDVLHPPECGVSVSTERHGATVEYHCWVAYEISEGGCIGYTTLDEYPPGWYRVRGRTFMTPSGPWGPGDADVETREEVIRWEKVNKNSEVEVGKLSDRVD